MHRFADKLFNGNYLFKANILAGIAQIKGNVEGLFRQQFIFGKSDLSGLTIFEPSVKTVSPDVVSTKNHKRVDAVTAVIDKRLFAGQIDIGAVRIDVRNTPVLELHRLVIFAEIPQLIYVLYAQGEVHVLHDGVADLAA